MARGDFFSWTGGMVLELGAAVGVIALLPGIDWQSLRPAEASESSGEFTARRNSFFSNEAPLAGNSSLQAPSAYAPHANPPTPALAPTSYHQPIAPQPGYAPQPFSPGAYQPPAAAPEIARAPPSGSWYTAPAPAVDAPPGAVEQTLDRASQQLLDAATRYFTADQRLPVSPPNWPTSNDPAASPRPTPHYRGNY